MLHLFLPYELGKILLFEFLDGNALLIGIGINEGFVHVFQVVLDFVVGRADDGLEAESPYQFNTAGHFFRIHLGKGFVQHHQADGRPAGQLG